MNRRLEPLTQRVRARPGKHTLLDTTEVQLSSKTNGTRGG